MLAIYREVERNTEDALALEAHLAECVACRVELVQFQRVGEQIRDLPTIEPHPEAHSRLMQALATEHVRFQQRSPQVAALSPTPVFLAPYLREAARKTPRPAHLTALASADTGPLPALQAIKARRGYRKNHYPVISIAASLLLFIMIGSMVSLFYLSPSPTTSPAPGGPAGVVQVSEVQLQNHDVPVTYPHVASAIEIENTIYYTTHNDSRTSWHLESYSEETRTSKLLLDQSGTQEMIVLGGTSEWLVWLQIDAPIARSSGEIEHKPDDDHSSTTRAWSLQFLPLTSVDETTTNSDEGSASSSTASAVQTLTEGKFDTANVPSWVQRPVQGIWFSQQALLVSLIDKDGVSYLQSYALDEEDIPVTELDNAQDGHILTSPTASNDGKSIFWAETWYDGKQLLSNIWTRQVIDATPDQTGLRVTRNEVYTYLFRDDGTSFRPQMVNNTLFILSTATSEDGTQATKEPTHESTTTVETATSTQVSGTQTPEPTATPPLVDTETLSGGSVKVDPAIFTPQLDEVQTGRILTFTSKGAPATLRSLSNIQGASALQGGAHFLLWLENGQRVRMYDVEAQLTVNVGAAVPQNAAFMAVNGDTAVVIVKPDENHTDGQTTMTFSTFRWPWTLKETPEEA